MAELSRRIRLEGIDFYIPHLQQALFHASRKAYRWIFGANRGGKTFALVAEAVWIATKTHPCYQPLHLRDQNGAFWSHLFAKTGLKCGDWPYKKPVSEPVRGRILGEDLSTLEVGPITTLKTMIPRRYLREKSWDTAFSKQEHVLHLDDGGWIQFKTYQQDEQSHAGTALNFVGFDEEPPLNIREENLMRLISTGGCEMGAMTPIKASAWVVTEILEKAVEGIGDTDVFKIDIDDNPHLNQEMRLSVAEKISRDPTTANARLHGDPVWLKGRVFEEYSDRHFILPFKVPTEWPVYIGIDPHDAKPTCVTFMAWNLKAAGQLPSVYIFKELHVRGNVIEVCKAIKAEAHGHNIRGVYIDRSADRRSQLVNPTNAVDTILAMFRMPHNFPFIIPVGGDPNGRREQIHQYLAEDVGAGGPHLFVTKDCPTVDFQLRNFHWKGPTPSGEDRSAEKVVKLNDDHVDNIGNLLLVGAPAWNSAPARKPVYVGFPGYADTEGRRVI